MKTNILSKIPKKCIRDLLLKLGFISAFTVVFSLTGYYISQNTEYEYTGIQKTTAIPQQVAESAHLYTLFLENGKLAILAPDGSKSYVQPKPYTLTEYDIKLLSAGICATKEELGEIIEELSS